MINCIPNTNVVLKNFRKEVFSPARKSGEETFRSNWKAFYKKYNLADQPDTVKTIFNELIKPGTIDEKTEFLNKYLTDVTSLIQIINATAPGNSEPTETVGQKEAEINKTPKETDRTFIYLNYGTSVARGMMQQQFLSDMVESMYVNADEFVLTEEDLNKNIRARQTALWNKIREFVQYVNKGEILPALFDDSGKYTGVIETYKDKLNNLISKGTNSAKLDYLYQSSLTGQLKDRSKLTLDAYNAWFLLKNFDRMLKATFGKGISIRKGMADSFINAESNKYMFGDTQKLSHTWRDESKDYDESGEFGDIPRNIIKTRQLYDKEGKPIENQKLQFSQVTTVVPKLWDMYYDATFRNIKLVDIFGTSGKFQMLQNKYRDLFGDEAVKLFIPNAQVTLGEILGTCGMDSTVGYPILFDILTTSEGMDKLQGLSDKELGVVMTLHKTLFDPNTKGSLMNIHLKYPPTNLTNSYYSYLSQMLNSLNRVILREYYETDDGDIELRTLFNKSLDEARYELERSISAKLESGITPLYTDDPEIGKDSCSVNLIYDVNGLGLRIVKNDKGETKLYHTDEVSDDVEITFSDVKNDFNSLRDLISMVTGMDFSLNSATSQIFEAKADRMSSEYTSLISFVADILYNYAIQQHLIENNKLGKDMDLNQFYPDKYFPKVNPDYSFQLIDKSRIPTLRDLAEIKSVVDGRVFNSTVRAGDGAQISVAQLSMLATDLKTQFELVEKRPESATNEFSFFDLFSGIDFVRDFKGKFLNAQGIKFNYSEVLTATLLDYFNGFGDVYKKNQISGMGFLASIVSDKARLPKININPLRNININGKSRRFIDLTTDEIKYLVDKELGGYYTKVRNDVNNRLAGFKTVLTTVENLGQHSILSKYFNPEASGAAIAANLVNADGTFNFDELNRIIDNAYAYTNSPLTRRQFTERFLHDIIVASNSSIELKEIIDYSIDGNGYLSMNENLYNQVWDKDFWDRKETEFINDFIYDEMSVSTNNLQGNPIGGNAFNQLRNKNSGWIDNNGKLGVAKITLYDKNGSPRQVLITDKQSIYNLDSAHTYENMIEDPNSTLEYRSSQQAIALANKYGIAIINGVVDEKALNVEEPSFNIQLLVGALNSVFAQKSLINNTKTIFDDASALEYLKNKGISTDRLSKAAIRRLAAIEAIKEGKGKSGIQNETYSSKGVKVEFNPALIKFNATDFLITQEFMLSTVGTHLNHPGKLDFAKWMQQVKRNVSLTASKHKGQLRQLDGLYDMCTVCVVKDDKDVVFNVTGKQDKAKPWDGSTYVNGYTSYLENNSLGDSRGGSTKKEFIHAKHGGSGTGIIVKTAGFPINNLGLRDSGVDYIGFMQPDMSTADSKYIIHRKINERDVQQFMNNPENFLGIDINKSFTGDKIFKDNQDFYIYDPYTQNYYRFNISADVTYENGITTVKYHPVDAQGNDIAGDVQYFSKSIRNAFDIWQLFGGEWSCSLMSKNGISKLIFSESSFKNGLKVINNIGEIIGTPQKIVSQTQVNQYVKKALVDFVVTEGAIKQGATNINSTDAIFDPNYDITTFKMNLFDFGIQLDAEHESDESTLSMMTQVVNALGARGYTSKESDRVYKALYNIAVENLGDLEQGLKVNDPQKFKESVAKLVVDCLKKASATDGALFEQIEFNLAPIIESNNVTLDTVQDELLIDHPSIFNKLMSNIAASLTNKCVRLEFPGQMCVLNPSNRLTKIYNGHLRSYYKGNLRKELSLVQTPLINISRVTLGATYFVCDASGNQILVDDAPLQYKIDSPVKYKEIKQLLNANGYKLKENLFAGRDLASSNAYFKVGDQEYCIWDLDIVQELQDPSLDKDTRKLKERELQTALDALGNGQGTVRVDGNVVEISDVEITPFECILPMIFKTQFGLEEGDDVKTIEDDKYFFLRRAIENGDFECAINNTNLFDIEIQVQNGQNVYLLTDYRGTVPEGLVLDTEVEKRKDLQGNWWLLDENGENKFRLSSDKDLIYRDGENMIVYTETPTFYINNIKGTLTISKSVGEFNGDINQFLDKLEDKQTFTDKNGKVHTTVNQRTKGLLKSLRKGTYINQDIIKGWNARMNFISELTADLSAQKDNLLVEPKTFQDYRRNDLVTKYLNKHASFIKSLKTVVARIPAQSHQSFMAMKCVGFSGGINNAMVSIHQLYLQGSDFRVLIPYKTFFLLF